VSTIASALREKQKSWRGYLSHDNSRPVTSLEERPLDAGGVLLEVPSPRTNQVANGLSEPSSVVAGLARADPNRSRSPKLNEVRIVEPNRVGLVHNSRCVVGGLEIRETVGRVTVDDRDHGCHRSCNEKTQRDGNPFQPPHPGLPLGSSKHRLPDEAPVKARIAVHGWLWFMDGACLNWIEHRDLSRDDVRDLLLGTLLGALAAADAVPSGANPQPEASVAPVL
jgi:hypothetical protein